MNGLSAERARWKVAGMNKGSKNELKYNAVISMHNNCSSWSDI